MHPEVLYIKIIIIPTNRWQVKMMTSFPLPIDIWRSIINYYRPIECNFNRIIYSVGHEMHSIAGCSIFMISVVCDRDKNTSNRVFEGHYRHTVLKITAIDYVNENRTEMVWQAGHHAEKPVQFMCLSITSPGSADRYYRSVSSSNVHLPASLVHPSNGDHHHQSTGTGQPIKN